MAPGDLLKVLVALLFLAAVGSLSFTTFQNYRVITHTFERVTSNMRNILQSIPTGVLTLDSHGIVTALNDSAKRLLGLRASVTLWGLPTLLSLGAAPAWARAADDAPIRCFLLHGDAALRACQEVITSSRPAEVRAEAHYNRGVELGDLGRHTEALREFAEAVRLKPDYTAAYTNMGVTLTKLLRWDDAVRAYRQATRQHPPYPDAYYNLGVALAHLRRWDEAVDALREAVQLNPRDADALYNLGLVLNTLHRHGEALEAYRSAVLVRPAYVSAWGNLGMTAYLLGRYRESAEAFEMALALAPDYFDTRPVQREAWDAARHQGLPGPGCR